MSIANSFNRNTAKFQAKYSSLYQYFSCIIRAMNKIKNILKRNKYALVAAFALLLLVGGFIVVSSSTNKPDPKDSNTISEGTISESPKSDEPTGSSAKADSPGVYEQYDSSKLSKASDSSVVLFFNAKWCSECQKANASFSSNPIPNNLTILSVDYDKNIELRKKYGVTFQHTFVQVDSDGNLIKKWSGSDTANEVASQIKS